MAELEITHIKKPYRDSPVHAIEEVGGPWGVSSLANAVAWAEQNGNKFFVRSPLGTAKVDVRVMLPRTAAGNKFLQTVADGRETNNLLSLPEITSSMRAIRR